MPPRKPVSHPDRPTNTTTLIRAFTPKFRLRTALIVPFVLQVIAVVGLVSCLYFYNGQKTINDIATQLRQDLAVRVEQNLRSYLAIPHLVNQNNAAAINLGQLDSQNLPELERYFWHQSNVFKTLAFLGLAFENKDIVGAERTDDDSLVLRVSSEANGHDFQTYSTDQNGDRLKLLHHKTNFDPRTRPWYKAAVAAGKPVWSEIYPNTAGLTAYLGASMPFFNKQGNLQGVLLTNINLSQIGNFLQSLRIGKTGQVFIIERSGLLVATSTGERPFRSTPKEFGAERVKAIDSHNGLTQATMQYLTKNFTANNNINIQQSKLLEFNVKGEREFLQVLPFRDEFGLDWLIVVVISESDFTGQITANTSNTIHLTLIALVIAIGLGVITAHYITRPILRISQASKAIAKGDLEQRVASSNIIEIETLIRAFNSMAGQLQGSFTALKQSETQNRAIVEALPDLLCRLSGDGTYLDNPIGRDRLKASFTNRRALKGFNISDSHPPHLVQQRMQAIRQALQTGELQVYEHQFVVNDQAIDEEVRVIKLADNEVMLMVRDITGRKQLEVALQESEARFRGVVEQASVGIALVTLTGQFTLANRRFCELVGYAESELCQLTNLEVTHPDDRAATSAAVRRLLTGESSTFSIDKRYIRKDGQMQWGNLTGSPIYNSQGELQYLLGILVDISERKQAEENLRIAEDNYRSIFENALEGIFQSTPEGRFVSVNPAMARIYGYSSPEEMVTSITDIGEQTFVDSAKREEFKRLIDEQGQVNDFEYQICQKDGSIVWIEENTRVVRDSEGNALYYEGIIQNITDRKRQKEILEAMVEERTTELAQTNAALQASEAELRGLFAAMDDVIIVYDRHGTCLRVASTNPDLLIKSSAEMVGHTVHDFLPKARADLRLQTIQQVLETRQTVNFEYSLMIGEDTSASETHEVWFSANLSPLSDDTVIMVSRDITERKQIEKALQSSEIELRALFAAMTDIVVVKDIHGRYCKVAPTNPSNLLAPSSGLVGLTEYDILPKAQADHFVNHIQQVLETQQTISIDYCLTIENREVWFTANVSPLGADTVVWVARDISERKRAEAELQAQQAFLRQVMDAVPSSIFVKDREDRFLSVNQAAAAVYGTTVEAMLGKTDMDFNPNREEVEGYRNNNQSVIESGQTKFIFDEIITNIKGETNWYQTSISPFIDATGEIKGVIGCATNISDRKRTEAALQESERKYRNIFENSQVGIGRTRIEDGLFLDANQRLAEILGYNSAADLIGRKFFSELYVNLDDRTRIVNELKQQGGVRDYELHLRRSNGSTFWGLLSVQFNLEESSTEFFITDISERKQAEAELQTQQAFLQQVMDAVSSSIFVKDPAGRFLAVNQAAAGIYGVTVEEMLGKTDLDFNRDREEVEHYLADNREVMSTRQTKIISDQAIRNRQGELHWYQTSISPFIDANGEVQGIIGALADITDRKQAEAALQESERKYRNIFENSQVGIGRTRIEDGLFLDANQRLAEILGYNSAADLIGQKFSSELYVNLDDRTRIVNELKQQGGVQDYELHLRRSNGSTFWGLLSVQFNLEESSTEFFITDISERKQAEAELQTQQAFLRQVIDAVPNSIFVKDREGRFLVVNQAEAEMYGATVEEMLGKTGFDFNPNHEDMKHYMNENQEVMATCQTKVVPDQAIINNQGELRWYQTSISPFIDANGEVQGIIGALTDITDRKRIEEALQESEQKYRNIFENSQVGIGRSRPEDGLILAANQRLVEILGFNSTADLIGQRYTTEFYWNSSDRQQVVTELEQQGEIRDLELQIRRQDNSMLWGMFSLKYNLEEACFEFVITDISDRKQAEAALQNSLTQLALANQEIQSLNQKLESENLRLSAELSVARQLQQMILPKEHEFDQIEDLEIAGFMKPAEEVGGDYYDVLHHNGTIKIGIGDVTGHGLESGVLMIMVQTAVRTLLANNETDPRRFLSTINQVIYDNAKRMNLNKNLSLALLDYQSRHVKLSGQHEEILVVRADGQIERIDTIDLGFFLGLLPDISEFIGQAEVQLQPGDGIVLYTDGVTEAENQAKEYYSLERLCHVISKNWRQPAVEIRQAIVEDVQLHIGQQEVYDDITLLVLKQK